MSRQLGRSPTSGTAWRRRSYHIYLELYSENVHTKSRIGKLSSSTISQTMDPNASIGRDDDRNSAVRPRMPVRPSSVSALLSPASPPRRCDDQGDSGGRVSRLRMHDSDDDDMTLQSAISQSGELSMQMPREGAGITPYDLAYEGPNGEKPHVAMTSR